MSDRSILEIWGNRAFILWVSLFVLSALFYRGCVYDPGEVAQESRVEKYREQAVIQQELIDKYSCGGNYCINEECTDDKGLCAIVLDKNDDVYEVERRGRTMCVTSKSRSQWELVWLQFNKEWYGPYPRTSLFREPSQPLEVLMEDLGVSFKNRERFTPDAYRFMAPITEEKGQAVFPFVRIFAKELCQTDDCDFFNVCGTPLVQLLLQ